MNRRGFGTLAIAAVATTLAGTRMAQAQTAASATLPVVASFSILADLVRQVGGERVAVTALVGPGSDAHSFNPGAQDARALKDARVLVVNGLDFEGWLPRLQKASGFKGRLITASDGIQARQFEEADGEHDAHGDAHSHGDHDHDHGHSHDHGTRDPHAWQDVGHVLRYVDNISKGLVQADPSGASLYQAAAARYSAQLRQLDTDIRAAVARIPQARRRLVTTHDAFGYFSAAYGIDFIGARGLSNESEPSAAGIARLVEQIRHDRIPAIFLETIGDPRLMQRLSAETGVALGGRLYSDALAPVGEPAGTYIGMMRSNLAQLEKALGQ